MYVYIYYTYIPLDPSTLSGSFWGVMLGVEYLSRKCLDTEGVYYVYIYIYIYIYVYVYVCMYVYIYIYI